MSYYFKSRGLNLSTVKKYKLKEEENFVRIPYFDANGKYLYCKCRSKREKSFWYWPKGKELCLYNLWGLASYRDYVVITEGEIDCLTLLQFGINAVACPGSNLFKREWAKLFDHISKIYTCFDNDPAGIEGSMKLSDEYFTDRDTYNILVPRDNGAKDLNDLLIKANYQEEDFCKLMSEAIRYGTKDKKPDRKADKEKKKKIKVSGFICEDKIGELIYSKDSRKGSFIVYDNKTCKYQTYEEFEASDEILIPDADDGLIYEGIIRIPSGTKDYGESRDLVSGIHQYLNKYVDIEEETDRDIVATYILLTWVYDKFTSIPYLRILGEYGTGKSRLLKVLNICYKSIYTSGNTSGAPIFRLIHRFGGTLLIDEAEFGRRSEKNEDIKDIVRFGKDSSGVITRCDGTDFSVKGYRAFGPKVLGSRRSYGDDALESRIIDIKMKETKAEHIPIILKKEEFEKDSDALRCKLLKWRLDNYFKIDTLAYEDYIDNDVSRRINEMNAPLICVRAGDKEFINSLLGKAKRKHEKLMEDKSMSLEANILKEIDRLYADEQKDPLVKEIAKNLSEDSPRNYMPRSIASIVRDSLGLETKRTREGNVILYDEEKVRKLLIEYNLEETG